MRQASNYPVMIQVYPGYHYVTEIRTVPAEVYVMGDFGDLVMLDDAACEQGFDFSLSAACNNSANAH